MTIKEFKKLCRRLQKEHKNELIMNGIIVQHNMSNKKQEYGFEDGYETGANFLDEFNFNYAKKRFKERSRNELYNIKKKPMFNNLLSSQALVFNLFCPLIQMIEQGKGNLVSAIFKNLFPCMNIKEVTGIEIEYFPKELISKLDCWGAFDAIVWYNDISNNKAFIAIESKYTEDSINKARKYIPSKHKRIIKEYDIFKAEWREKLLSKQEKFSQAYSNMILSESYKRQQGYATFYYIVLSMESHPNIKGEIKDLKNKVQPYLEQHICHMSFEQIIEKVLNKSDEESRSSFEKFKNRYLVFDKLPQPASQKESVRPRLQNKKKQSQTNINITVESCKTQKKPSMSVYTHYASEQIYKGKRGIINFRWGEIIKLGNSNNVIGMVFLHNPDNKWKVINVGPSEYLDYFVKDPNYWRKLHTLHKMHLSIIDLISNYYRFHNHTEQIEGVIHVFYLINVAKEKNCHKILKMPEKDIPPFTFSTEEDIVCFHKNMMSVPTYIGWGKIEKENKLRTVAEKIFESVLHSNNYLDPSFDNNPFYSPIDLLAEISTDEKVRIRNKFIEMSFDYFLGE